MTMMTGSIRGGGGVIALLGAFLLCACAGSDEVRIRAGTTPFPAPFMLYAVADPDDLGPHQSSPHVIFAKENGQGLLYTCEAGFLDLSHIRETIDLARAFTRACQRALDEGEQSFEVEALYPGVFHVTLDQAPGAADAGIDRFAIEIGLYAAWISTIWHEIITEFGYKYTVLLSEEKSAFTWDDTMSHVIGLEIAQRALMETAGEGVDDGVFDDAVTRLLDESLGALDVVSKEECERAVHLVEGAWWHDGETLKRQIDMGFESGVIAPWLVPAFDRCPYAAASPRAVPTLVNPLVSIEIDPRIAEGWAIRTVLPGRPERINAVRDFPIIMDHLRAEFESRFGAGFDLPE